MRLLTTINLAAFATLAAMPAQATPLWQLILRNQMQSDLKCSTNYYSDIREHETADRIDLSARVHCSDGRTFDAHWDLRAHRFSVSPAASPPKAHEEHLMDR